LEQLLYEWNDTGADYPKEKTIDQLFEAQMGKRGDRIAVISRAVSITYNQLNRRANQLAYLLQKKGVIPNTIVSIMVEPSIEMMVGIIGILKAGGAYLPIDPDYPEARIRYMQVDSNARILLSAKDIEPSEDYRSYRSYFPTEANNLAYIIYTSGTTGKPKGVMIEHRNVVRLMFNNKFQFDFSDNDVWTMFHSCCFDFSVWEMYGALLYGGKLVIIPKMAARDPQRFLEIMKEEKVTVLNQTPSAFYNLAFHELKSPGKRLYLKVVIFGGEALTPLKLKEWKEKYPGTKLVNMFGITETTVHVTYKEINAEEIELNISNIGKPIPTLSTYILDENLKPVPIGVIGELWVGGEGVGRGYLNRVELTKEKFVENPYRTGDRLYRSGDLARLSQKGEIEYSGRLDHQVKIRGFRIELGEIESRLLKHDEIKEAVVIAKEATDEKHLWAYIVSNREFAVSELREYLSGELPDYMIPSFFVQLDKIPLTPNGKIDRKALPEPEIKKSEEYTAPSGEMEETLARIWAEVLGIEKDVLGIDANFFEWGGHSLKAARLISEIHKTFNCKVPLRAIFSFPTIRLLAAVIEEAALEQYVPIRPSEEKEYYELSPAQKRLYILQQMETDNISYNIPLMMLLEGDVNRAKPGEALKKLIHRHDSLRTSFITAADKPMQKVHEEVDFEI
jgi:amino acid adenylation domain-containing protein